MTLLNFGKFPSYVTLGGEEGLQTDDIVVSSGLTKDVENDVITIGLEQFILDAAVGEAGQNIIPDFSLYGLVGPIVIGETIWTGDSVNIENGRIECDVAPTGDPVELRIFLDNVLSLIGTIPIGATTGSWSGLPVLLTFNTVIRGQVITGGSAQNLRVALY